MLGGCHGPSPGPASNPQPAVVPEPVNDSREKPTPLSDETRPAMTYHNPIIPGTNPDPSICRVGDDYYLVTSSFEYFPGVPIYHSKDLVNFEQIGYVLDRKSQLSLDGLKSSDGIFAPTIRHHAGTFYMVTTNMGGGGSFYVTAEDPRGPWSEPIWVKEDVFTMDPSLFFDDDGTAFYTRHGEQRDGGIFQAPIDIKTGKLLAKPVEVWGGTGGIWPEGPHLYKVDGTYYLLISEGGTSYEHMITVARSKNAMGPFEAAPHNPLLTHRYLPAHPIQATGHGDLVQAPEGSWWMVLLGIRPSTPGHHHIGRETFLSPVSWKDGWPVINDGKPIELEMSGHGLPPREATAVAAMREEFDASKPSLAWRHVRNPREESYSLSARPGYLRLLGSPVSLADVGSPTLLVRPQTHLRMEASTEVDVAPTPGSRAGLVVRGNENNHYELVVEVTKDGQRAVVLRTRIMGKAEEVKRVPVPPGPTRLFLQGRTDAYSFSFSQDGDQPIEMGTAPTTPFAYERSQSFTGAFIGLYAHTANSQVKFTADFSWFEMRSVG